MKRKKPKIRISKAPRSNEDPFILMSRILLDLLAVAVLLLFVHIQLKLF